MLIHMSTHEHLALSLLPIRSFCIHMSLTDNILNYYKEIHLIFYRACNELPFSCWNMQLVRPQQEEFSQKALKSNSSGHLNSIVRLQNIAQKSYGLLHGLFWGRFPFKCRLYVNLSLQNPSRLLTSANDPLSAHHT